MKDHNSKITLRKNAEKWTMFTDGSFKFEENNKLVETVSWHRFSTAVRDKGICPRKYIESHSLVGIGVYCLWLFEIFPCIWIIASRYHANSSHAFTSTTEESLCWSVRTICNELVHDTKNIFLWIKWYLFACFRMERVHMSLNFSAVWLSLFHSIDFSISLTIYSQCIAIFTTKERSWLYFAYFS